MNTASLAALLGLAVLALAAQPGAAAGSRSVLATSDEPTARTFKKHDDCDEGLTRCVFDSSPHGIEPKAFCIDLDNDSNNCGSCGAACADAAPIDDGESVHAISNAPSVCKAGVCQCPVGYTRCSGKCVSLDTDYQNCGSCGNSCIDFFPGNPGTTRCKSGKCTCQAGNGPVALPTGGFECAPLQCKAIDPYAGVLLVPQLVATGSSSYGLEVNVSLGTNPLTNPATVNFVGEPSLGATFTRLSDTFFMCFQKDSVSLLYTSNNVATPGSLSNAATSNVLKYIDACQIEITGSDAVAAFPGCVALIPGTVTAVSPGLGGSTTSSITLTNPTNILPAQQPRISSAITILPPPAPTAYPLCINAVNLQVVLNTSPAVQGCPASWTNADITAALQGVSRSIVCGKCTEYAP